MHGPEDMEPSEHEEEADGPPKRAEDEEVEGREKRKRETDRERKMNTAH